MGRRTRTNLKKIARVEKLNQFFDLEISNIRRSDNFLHLSTSRGPFQLARADQDDGTLIFLFSAGQHVKANGFNQVISMYQSKDAYPYIRYHGQKFILRDEVGGEPFTYTAENIKKALEMLARFHLAARGFNPMPGSEFKVSWGKWPDRCFAEVNELVKKKLELKDNRFSAFDDKFWEQVDRLIERGLMAWQRFNHENYRKVLKQEMEAKAFNLHSVKADNLLLVDGKVIIKSMERARFELQVYDLAIFLDEILEKSEIPPAEVASYLQHYTKIRPLGREEREALLAFLFYPKGLYRLVRHYYRNRQVRDGLTRFVEFVKLMDKEDEMIQCLMQELEG